MKISIKRVIVLLCLIFVVCTVFVILQENSHKKQMKFRKSLVYLNGTIHLTKLNAKHTISSPTILQTNHTTSSLTILQTNHTTSSLTILQTNHTTSSLTILQTNHTTSSSTILQTNHTTTSSTVLQTNHTTTSSTVLNTNQTTTGLTELSTIYNTTGIPMMNTTYNTTYNLTAWLCVNADNVIVLEFRNDTFYVPIKDIFDPDTITWFDVVVDFCAPGYMHNITIEFCNLTFVTIENCRSNAGVKTMFYYTSIIVFVMGSFGCLGNVLSIVAVYKADYSLTSTSIYLIALATSDSLCLVSYICVYLDNWFYYSGFLSFFDFLAYVVIEIFKSISHWLLIVITVERYMSIYSPFTVQDKCYPKSAKLVVLLVTFKCIALYTIMFLSGLNCYPIYGDTDYSELCDFRIWETTVSVHSFSIPIIVIFVLNILIVRGLYKALKHRGELTKSVSNQERRITILLIIVSTTFLICVGPGRIYAILYQYSGLHVDTYTYYYIENILDLLNVLNYCLNCIIYSFSGTKYQESFRALFKQKSCKSHAHVI